MVEVIKAPVVGGEDGALSFLGWIWTNIWLIVIAIICIVLAFVIYYLFKRMEEERHERDDPVYERYKNYMRDCELNADKSKIRKNYSLVNLLWLGIPLVKKEHSSRIIGMSGELFGFYRGHSWSQDGYYILLCYKEKSFIFFESRFLIKVPYKVMVTVKKLDKISGEPMLDINKRPIPLRQIIDYSKFMDEFPNGDIRLWSPSLQKISYFRYPVFVDKDKNLIDMRGMIGTNIIEDSQTAMLGRILSTGSTMVEKAMLHNPNVKYNQLSPEKTKVEQVEAKD